MATKWYQDVPISPDRMELIETVNEVVEDYQAQGYDLTLRQLYYQLVTQLVFPNSESSYKKLIRTVSDGRMMGLIDWDAFVDRTRTLEQHTHYDNAEDVIAAAHYSYRLDKWADQDNRVEVWVEKEAAINIVARICSRWDVPYFATRGYTSITSIREAGVRLMGYYDSEPEQWPVVLYLGDHDPSGVDMSRDIVDRLNLFMEGVPLDFRRIALNMDQVHEHNPLPNPTKFTDSRSRAYNDKYGVEGWELDALSPVVITEIIERAIKYNLDEDKFNAIQKQETEEKEILSSTRQLWPDVVEFINGRVKRNPVA